MRSRGLTAKQSSSQVTGWCGDYDKLAMTRRLMHEAFTVSLDDIRDQCLVVGDSPNDAPMFAFFPNAVGVANLRAFLDLIAVPPRFITEADAGTGLYALADFLLVN